MMTKLRTKKRTKVHAKKAHKAKPAVETRQAERTKLVVSATVFPDRLSPDNIGHKVWITNISLGGLAFRTRRQYEEGSSCFVRLDAGPIRFENPVRVAWCRRRDEFTFEVGAQFIPD
jgi:hypothetical protein